MSNKSPSLHVANVNCIGGRHVVAVSERIGKRTYSSLTPEENYRRRIRIENGSFLGHTPVRREQVQTSLILMNHRHGSEYSLDKVRAIKVLAPEFRCRCLEVLSAWRVYVHWSQERLNWVFNKSERWKNIPEALDCMNAFPEKAGKRFKNILNEHPVTRSDFLALIPLSLRAAAKKARQVSEKRNKRKRVADFATDSMGRGPKFVEEFMSKTFGTSFLIRSVRSTLEEKERLGDDFFRKFYPLLVREAEKCGFETSRKRSYRVGSFSHKEGWEILSKIQGTRSISPIAPGIYKTSKVAQWVHYFYNSVWMKEVLEKGYFPIQIPPRSFWEFHYGERLFPSFLLVGRWERTHSGQHRFVTTYLSLSLRNYGPLKNTLPAPNNYLSPQEKKERNNFYLFADFNHVFDDEETS